MIRTDHQVHGLAGDAIAPDWPPLTADEVAALLRRYRDIDGPARIVWHSPRPLSAACLVETAHATVFVKRHHQSVRSVASLTEEHRFMAHLRDRGVPVPLLHADSDGQTAVGLGDWVYELHAQAAGIDLYRDAMSWEPIPNLAHASAAGDMLARLHMASAGYDAAQRDTHILVARCELTASPSPIATLTAQLPQRPALARYLARRDWAAELGDLFAPWHAALQPRLQKQKPLWTHGDWHVSNLSWSGTGDDAGICGVLDFGLAARTFALFDLATAIERNAIAWLALDSGDDAVHLNIVQALLDGYRQRLPLSADDVHLLADLLPLVHVDFALSEVEYFEGIVGSRASADVAYDTFLRGHAAWFSTAPGQRLVQAIHTMA